MQVLSFLHKIFKKSCKGIHSKRLESLLEICQSVLNGGKLSLTSLGRHLAGSSKVKNKLKKVDRLLGNAHMDKDRKELYSAMASSIIGYRKDITVVVDWSACVEHPHHMLRASLATKQSAITLYEEVYPEKSMGTYRVHKRFLNNLKQIIPTGVNVLIVTDAGFRTEWFELVLKQGWDFEGRIRTEMSYSIDDGETWKSYRALYSQATNKPQYIGRVLLTKQNKLETEMYLYKESVEETKGKKYQRRNKKGKMPDIYRKMYKDPWVLVTSRPHREKKASWVIKQYRLRMKIELEFRSSKNSKWGMGLENTLTFQSQRLQILLLIGAIAMFGLWLIGLQAEIEQRHYAYQANTIRTRRVLSLVFLGLQIVIHQPTLITKEFMLTALANLSRLGDN